MTQNNALKQARPVQSASGTEKAAGERHIVRAPVHDAGARAALVATAGALAQQDGVVGVELLRQDGKLVMVGTFQDAQFRAAWLAKGHDTPPASQAAQRKPPPFWKRWTVSMIAVYPALILLVYATQPLTSGMHTTASLFIVAFLLTGLSTGLIMPFLNRRLGPWLAAR